MDSNCIQVGDEYCPFRWVGNTLEAFVNDRWVRVVRTDKKNSRKEWVFAVADETK